MCGSRSTRSSPPARGPRRLGIIVSWGNTRRCCCPSTCGCCAPCEPKPRWPQRRRSTRSSNNGTSASMTASARSLMATTTTSRPQADLVYLCRALKASALAQAHERLAERARAEEWTHQEFLAACLEREVAARQANGGEIRIRAARLPARKTLEEFDFDHQRSLRRDVIAHLCALDFVAARDNVVFLCPPGTGKTH